MLRSRKFLIWLITLIVFVGIILLELFLGRTELFIGEIGLALTGISGVYFGANVSQKKVLK